MAGKPITRGSRRLGYAVDALSKNTLADIVIDRIRAEIGDEATDEQVADCLQKWIEPVAALRGDKPVNVLAKLANFDRFEEAYRERQQTNGAPSK